MAKLDLHDIQGNIVKGYGRYGFPKARYVFFSINKEQPGRVFLNKVIALVTTSEPWENYGKTQNNAALPSVTTNIAFSYQGLKRLGLSRQSLQSFPTDFAMGMKARHDILGDDGASAPQNWDPIWRDNEVHCWLSINGRDEDSIEQRYQTILRFIGESNEGVTLISGHRGDNGADNLDYQQASAVFNNGNPTPKEHFGYTDGISDPYFKGTETNPLNVIGGGKRTKEDPSTTAGWQPIETGEFILGHRDEAFETPTNAPMPRLLAHNGTYMVYRKLHENVASFNDYIENTGKDFPGGKEAVAAKFVGRWRNGVPLTSFPTEEKANAFLSELAAAKKQLSEIDAQANANEQELNTARQKYAALKKQFVAFDYNNDIDGGKCPVGAHARRANPRGALAFGVKKAFQTPGALVDRRRIARRGLPYGEVKDPTKNNGNHGIIFMAINASIERQFEFVQQQWINYSNDFKLGNDKDPIVGNHEIDQEGACQGKMTLEGDRNQNRPPFFCSAMPRFVETRGGEYFFIPSLTALKMIAEGIVDPT
ncbi:MAG: peroxidase [Gammaproteobacteria bacterium]|nr:MAG: peroxidase [Gammaproteobacteria bacterium]